MIQIVATGTHAERLVTAAEEYRATFLEFMTNVMKSHKPQLTEDEQQIVMEKVVRLINEEYRATTWIVSIQQGMPTRVIDGFYMLTPTILKWAGRKKPGKYKEFEQPIPVCKNGRVIRNAKGL